MPNFSPLRRLSLYAIITAMLVIFSGTMTESAYGQDNKPAPKVTKKKVAQELASTKEDLSSKVAINKQNLETLSDALSGFIANSEIKTDVTKDEVMYKLIEYINTPYLWGGTSKRGIDCSAFIQTLYYQALGVMLPRTSLEQSNEGEIVSREDLKFGDLVFFDTMHKGRVTHVGMYLGDGYFCHSGSSTGVAVASLDSEFYSRVFLKAKRVVQE